MTLSQKLNLLRQEYTTANEERRKQIIFTVEMLKRSEFLKDKKLTQSDT